MRTWFLILPFAMAVAGWAAPDLRVLATGALSAVTRPGERVVRTEQDWQKLWDEHAARVEPKPALPAVDFNKEMVVAVFMGRRPTGGYSVSVTGVRRGEKDVVVSVRRNSPPPGAITPQIVTSPYVFVAISKSDRPVKFAITDVGGRS